MYKALLISALSVFVASCSVLPIKQTTNTGCYELTTNTVILVPQQRTLTVDPELIFTIHLNTNTGILHRVKENAYASCTRTQDIFSCVEKDYTTTIGISDYPKWSYFINRSPAFGGEYVNPKIKEVACE